MQRRKFIQTGGAAALATALAQPLQALQPMNPALEFGLQLWTVRNQLEADMPGTIKAVAEAGYGQVELMNILDSTEIVQAAQDAGMKVRSAFFNWETIGNPTDSTPDIETIIEKAKEFELEYMVFGYIGKSARDTADKIKAISDRTNAAAEKVAAAGMRLSYHNHAFEFEPLGDEPCAFEIFMERFDSKLVNFELDVFWAAIGGWDPAETLKKLDKRVGQVHLKDLKEGTGTIYDEGKVPHEAFQEVGDGTIDMKAVMEVSQASGVTQFHVEQDQSPDPIASIGQSAKYLGIQ